MRCMELPRSGRKLSNAYDDRRRGIDTQRRSTKRADTDITAHAIPQEAPSGRIAYVPIAICANGDCLRGCWRECRAEAEHVARDLANRLRERFSKGFGRAADTDLTEEVA